MKNLGVGQKVPRILTPKPRELRSSLPKPGKFPNKPGRCRQHLDNVVKEPGKCHEKNRGNVMKRTGEMTEG